MIMEKADKQRRTLFIKKTFQMKFILQFVLLVVLGAVISGTLLYFFMSSELEAQMSSAHLTMRNTWDMLKPSIFITHITALVIISLVTVYLVLYFSHKIAGPLYRLEKTADQVGAGDLSLVIKLRDKDELGPFKQSLQTMIDRLGEKISIIQDSCARLKENEKRIVDAISESSLADDEKHALIETVNESIDRSNEALAGFKVKSS